ncbi:MAG TPA: M20/M25/M40 family metallo-hydrolase [Candidatus Bilamarchaeum sp.]|nr:M20/M25/M40 family metallo-hydrolase [Candidatus Bilamarchaeum sp.]
MDAVDLLRRLVSIKSAGPNERELGAHIEGLLREGGFRTKRLEIAPGRFNILAERDGAGAPIGLYGHMDSVEPAQGWKADPYVLREEGDKLTGLGAWDMKAGLAAILCATREATARPLRIAFGVDEENISEGAHAIVESGFFRSCQVIVSTDTGGDGGEHFGERQLTLGRLGRAVYSFDVPGKAGHAAGNEGINAVEEGAKLVRELKKIRPPKHRLLPPPPVFVRYFHAETSSLSMPERCVIELDRHLVPPETAESVLTELRNGIRWLYETGLFREIDGKRIEAKLKERKTPYLVPQLTERKNPDVKKFERIISANFGEPKIVYGNSVADENVLALSGVPVITYGPRGGLMHSAEEWVSKESCLNIVKGLGSFLRSE